MGEGVKSELSHSDDLRIGCSVFSVPSLVKNRDSPRAMPDPLALLLKNQGLTEPLPDPDAALERVVAVQTQYAQSLEIALAARSKKRLKGWEMRGLAPEGHLHKSWGLRHTLHTHGPQGWALVHGAVGEIMNARHHRRMREFPEFDAHAIEARILEILAEGPRTRPEIHARIPGLENLHGVGWGRDVAGLAFQGRLKVVGRGAEQRFALANPPLSSGGEGPGVRGLESLLHAYLRAYGPATVKDFSHWTNLPQRDVSPVFAAIRDRLLEIDGGFALDMNEAPAPPAAILLAKFDPLVLGHADKTRWLAPEHYKRVFRIAAQVEAVVLLRGRAAATWRLARKANRATVTIEPFRALRPPERRAIERAAAKLGASIGWGEVEIEYL